MILPVKMNDLPLFAQGNSEKKYKYGKNNKLIKGDTVLLSDFFFID